METGRGGLGRDRTSASWPRQAGPRTVGAPAQIAHRLNAASDLVVGTPAGEQRSGSASLIARFFVGLDAAANATDADSEDVTVVDRVDGPAAVPHLRLYPLLRWRHWALHATHFLAADDDAHFSLCGYSADGSRRRLRDWRTRLRYPFVDRIVAELVAGAALSCPALRGEGRATRVAFQETFVWGYFMLRAAGAYIKAAAATWVFRGDGVAATPRR